MIRQVLAADAGAIAAIYNHYIQETAVTFEETPVTASDILKRIARIQQAQLPWLVAEENSTLIGYAYATPWSERSAYRYSVETTVYVSRTAVANGWGTSLYNALFTELRNNSIHVAIGGITLPNPASIALHEKLGMTKVAHFKEVGYKFGKWLDVGYWQVQLNP
ncbi:MAG: arsinothricin resistance N-acetyltransferase ArsN1 family B [Gammaproteobacteria bacterium]